MINKSKATDTHLNRWHIHSCLNIFVFRFAITSILKWLAHQNTMFVLQTHVGFYRVIPLGKIDFGV